MTFLPSHCFRYKPDRDTRAHSSFECQPSHLQKTSFLCGSTPAPREKSRAYILYYDNNKTKRRPRGMREKKRQKTYYKQISFRFLKGSSLFSLFKKRLFNEENPPTWVGSFSTLVHPELPPIPSSYSSAIKRQRKVIWRVFQ